MTENRFQIWDSNNSNPLLSYLFRRRKPGPLGQVRAPRLCRESAASGSGMMEYWNDGMLGIEDWDLFL